MEDVVIPTPSKISAIMLSDIPMLIVKMLLIKRVLLLVEKNTELEANVSWELYTIVEL